jgi:hypothetical protein
MKKEIKPPRHPHQDGDDEKNLTQLAGELERLEKAVMGRKPPTILHGRIDHLRQLITKKDATRRTTIIK